jgi:SAM-dependent methyltransferase
MSEENFAAQSYGPRAGAYVASTVHAQGADLDQMEALLAGRGFGTVLDLGCGGGHVSYRAAAHAGQVVAVDVTPPMLAAVAQEAARRGIGNITTQHAAAEALPFGDAVFDAVLCRFTAHHWADFAAGLREARRVAKPGALGFFADTVAPESRALDTLLQAVELLRDPSHVRNDAAAQWRAALAQAGWVVESVTPRRLPLEFRSWIARTQTPLAAVTGIARLWDAAPQAAREYFALTAAGDFTIDTAVFVVRAG